MVVYRGDVPVVFVLNGLGRWFTSIASLRTLWS
jgi:hypothetical protein